MSADPGSFELGAPAGLAAAMRLRDATIESAWREADRAYAQASAPEGPLFARYSDDPGDGPRLEHEAAVRALVGTTGALRAPPVLARGPGWLLERGIRIEPLSGRAAIAAAIAASAELMDVELPVAPGAAGPGRRLAGAARMIRSSAGALRMSDLAAARRELAVTTLPEVSCHRDFHPQNVLISDGAAWVIDWERCGRGPAGLDLLQLWAGLEREDDRTVLFEGIVDLLGTDRRRELVRLRFGVAVATAVGMLAAREAFDRDAAAIARLLRLVPELRRQAKAARRA